MVQPNEYSKIYLKQNDTLDEERQTKQFDDNITDAACYVSTSRNLIATIIINDPYVQQRQSVQTGNNKNRPARLTVSGSFKLKCHVCYAAARVTNTFDFFVLLFKHLLPRYDNN